VCWFRLRGEDVFAFLDLVRGGCFLLRFGDSNELVFGGHQAPTHEKSTYSPYKVNKFVLVYGLVVGRSCAVVRRTPGRLVPRRPVSLPFPSSLRRHGQRIDSDDRTHPYMTAVNFEPLHQSLVGKVVCPTVR
jgi:hypothetical protein